MSILTKSLHPDSLQLLKRLGYSARERCYIASLVSRYLYLKGIRGAKSIQLQEKNAIDFIIQKAISISCDELVSGELESEDGI